MSWSGSLNLALTEPQFYAGLALGLTVLFWVGYAIRNVGRKS